MGNVFKPDAQRIREVQTLVLPIYNREETAECRRCWGQETCRKSCVAESLLSGDSATPKCGDGVVRLEALLRSAVKMPASQAVLPRV